MTKISAALIAFAAITLSACSEPAQAGRTDEVSRPDPVERGRYLVSIMGCNDCHTPWVMGPNGPEPDMTRMLSGHPQEIGELPPFAIGKNEPWVWAAFGTNTAFSGPWGRSYAFNLTPEEHTGILIWTEEMFIDTIKKGRHMGSGRPLNPPMPQPAYKNATVDDLKAIYAYLRTIPPIKNKVPEYQPPR